MASRKHYFPNAEGLNLAAYLDLPDGHTPVAYALFAHCFTCSKNIKTVARVSRALADRSIAVLRFDFTGIGESEGDFSDTNFTSNVEDVIAAADFLQRQFEAPKLLIGHSLGGAAVLQAAEKIPSALAIVTLAAPHDPTHLGELLRSTKEEAEAMGLAEVVIGGKRFRIKKQFFDDLERNRMRESLRRLRRPYLILQATEDTTVPILHAERLFADARQPKSFIAMDGADHLLSRESDAQYAGAIIAAWANRYLTKRA